MVEGLILASEPGSSPHEVTKSKPKPKVAISGRPIFWHFIKKLSVQRVEEFFVVVSHNSREIKEYILNYHSKSNDVTIDILLIRQLKYVCDFRYLYIYNERLAGRDLQTTFKFYMSHRERRSSLEQAGRNMKNFGKCNV